MHELHTTQTILETAIQHAEDAQATHVTDLHLINGVLSSYKDESIRLYWEMVSRGTLCDGAELHFHHVPALCICQACGESFSPQLCDEPCPACSSLSVNLVQGKEFRLDSIEIERFG
ncbi:MAG: hydrogenase maturation nickel metallochaperone HypA [Anaerolineae bacterium]|nr:hydrogenase maturation nickel metallochaperone HypA [Anaerolineae bacterium]